MQLVAVEINLREVRGELVARARLRTGLGDAARERVKPTSERRDVARGVNHVQRGAQRPAAARELGHLAHDRAHLAPECDQLVLLSTFAACTQTRTPRARVVAHLASEPHALGVELLDLVSDALARLGRHRTESELLGGRSLFLLHLDSSTTSSSHQQLLLPLARSPICDLLSLILLGLPRGITAVQVFDWLSPFVRKKTR